MKITPLDFFKFLFEDKAKDEYITIFATNKEKPEQTTVKHYKSINGALEYANKIKSHWNVYVNLACTDGKGRATENLTSRNVIALDFDLKQMGEGFNHKDLLHIFQKNGLYQHMVIASGGGYHVYLKTDRTKDLDKLSAINKAIAVRLGADEKATLKTQVLRVLGTYNHKYTTNRKVSGMFKAPKIINYNLDKLQQQYIYDTTVDETLIKYIPSRNMPPCIESMLKGIAKGQRDYALYSLTSYLNHNNYSKPKIMALMKEWNSKCTPPMKESELEYHVNYCIDKNLYMFGCESDNEERNQFISEHCDKMKCKSGDKFKRVFVDGIETVEYEYKLLENIKRQGTRIMLQGNHLAIISVMKVKGSIMTMNDLEKALTPFKAGKQKERPKCIISKPTRLKVMKELEDLGIVEVIKGKGNLPNTYKLKDIKCLDSEKVVVSYHATKRFIDGAINQSAFRLYCYMMYRLSKGENVVQEEIARDLDLKQQAISKLIKELEGAEYIKVHLDYSVNPLGANRYKCIY